jgi:SAM-dependent methyltransferase
MVEWCGKNLPFAAVALTGLEPPLPFADESFGFVYAFSVFTHLSEELQVAWIDESRRVLRPGGYLLISTLGEYYVSRKRLSEAERASFSRGELVVLYERSAGTSLCSAYHPPEYVREKLARGLDVVSFRPAVAGGGHDVHLLRRQR